MTTATLIKKLVAIGIWLICIAFCLRSQQGELAAFAAIFGFFLILSIDDERNRYS